MENTRWPHKLTYDQAIKLFDKLTDKDDPFWESLVVATFLQETERLREVIIAKHQQIERLEARNARLLEVLKALRYGTASEIMLTTAELQVGDLYDEETDTMPDFVRVIDALTQKEKIERLKNRDEAIAEEKEQSK